MIRRAGSLFYNSHISRCNWCVRGGCSCGSAAAAARRDVQHQSCEHNQSSVPLQRARDLMSQFGHARKKQPHTRPRSTPDHF